MFSSDYGFIVDYLAEVLKELRKEDRTNDFSEFFQLSDTITTRDKTSIAKTYAGLSKVIYPNGGIPLEEARELLDFSIECRKRVKEQLRKMDETFEKVDFSYSSKEMEEPIEIKTLEEIEYGDLIGNQETESHKQVEPSESEVVTEETSVKDFLKEGQKIIRDNQSGLSYDNLFGSYLLDATKIKLIDPYIRLPYQLRNFMEFVRLVSEKKDPLKEVELHLVTTNSEDYIEGVKEKFYQMTYSLESMGINFTYEFDEYIHDRSIEMDNGWKIVLGRGLDIYQKTGGYADITDYIQERRLCKACEITFVKN
jgi:ATP-dependent Lon protease